ncbi:hypothetical protein [Microvirga sp. 2TAF3]|uniref:hypothetical protein n=1 Tax=Microvirga sp. 2TAF3 TaxID=3233014 RepID=UPI003F94E403
MWHRKERKLLAHADDLNAFDYLPAPRETTGEPDRWINEPSREGALFTKQAPLVFIVAWCYFAGLPFVMDSFA